MNRKKEIAALLSYLNLISMSLIFFAFSSFLLRNFFLLTFIYMVGATPTKIPLDMFEHIVNINLMY